MQIRAAEISDIIREQNCNAEWALRTQLDELLAQFSDIEDPYLREREDDVRQVAEQMLRGMECAVETCGDGTEAVKRARSARDQGTPFDAIILDLTVPGGLGGAEAVTLIVERENA